MCFWWPRAYGHSCLVPSTTQAGELPTGLCIQSFLCGCVRSMRLFAVAAAGAVAATWGVGVVMAAC
jgi:hypothetical protein